MYCSRYQARWWKGVLIIASIIFVLTQFALAKDPLKLWGQEGIQIKPGGFFVSDGSGGVLVITEKINIMETPPGETQRGLIVQRIDANGMTLWGDKGVYHTTGDLSYSAIVGKEQMVSDMTGGIIILLIENGTDLYAQRIDATGIKRWGDKGVLVASGCRNPECRERGNPQIVSDGSGGGILIWNEWASAQRSIWAQRINADGESVWALNGIQIAITDSPKVIVGDGKRGAIIAWKGEGLRAQRIDGDGMVRWHPDGVVVDDDIGITFFYQEGFSMIEDGSGEAILAWVGSDPTDFRIPSIYAQKVNADGINQWENKILITANPGTQSSITMITDGDGGSIIRYDYHIQRVTALGTLLWGPDGFFIDTQGRASPIQIISDGAGGAITLWQTVEEVEIPWQEWIISKAQRLSPSSAPMWANDGFEVSRSAYLSSPSFRAITDGYSGIITDSGCYPSTVNLGSYDCYVQRINDGLPSLPTRTLLVKKIGSGTGKVSSNPIGLECGVGCFGVFNPGTQIALTPVPATGSTFLGLDGDFDCSDGIVTIIDLRISNAI